MPLEDLYMKKKKETMSGFMTRRNKEAGKIKIPETKTHDALSAGSHKLYEMQKENGFVKPKKRKKLQKIEHLIKKRNMGEDVH